jgi:hypothetical protein|tara:strand:+ start:79 stop:387 length:309 start_codon:yes stop_codon:yes gene_type:complete
MRKKIIYLLLSVVFFSTSCSSLSEVKRGLTGEKKQATDEFLVQKKDPLILPPDYESLPSPDERIAAKDEISAFEKTLETSIEESSSSSDSVESAILKKIRSK